MMFDKEGYPCSGHDCYDRGNYHMGCSGCPYHYGKNNQPKDQQEGK